MNRILASEFVRSCRKNPVFIIGSIAVLIFVLCALFADFIAPYAYDEPHKADRLQPPSSKFLLGTDDFGRDMFSRIIYGTRISLKVAMIGATLPLLIGVTFGLLSGFFGGNVDRVLMFIADITWCIPGMILALAVITILGKGLTNSIIAISLVNWAQYARTVRAKTMALRNMAFVETGIAFGEKPLSLMLRYIMPNVIPSLIVMVSTHLPAIIVSTTALSFLGLGSQPPDPDWGLMISNGVGFINRAPWLIIYPGLALVYTVLGFNLLGEGLRDILDPRLKSL
jgi:ABC-type dipeptide/oligopeptide/nickel transport system permease subunit